MAFNDGKKLTNSEIAYQFRVNTFKWLYLRAREPSVKPEHYLAEDMEEHISNFLNNEPFLKMEIKNAQN